jgi:hypothetical protein
MATHWQERQAGPQPLDRSRDLLAEQGACDAGSPEAPVGLQYHAVRVPAAAPPLPHQLDGVAAGAPGSRPLPWQVFPMRDVLRVVRVGPATWPAIYVVFGLGVPDSLGSNLIVFWLTCFCVCVMPVDVTTGTASATVMRPLKAALEEDADSKPEGGPGGGGGTICQ